MQVERYKELKELVHRQGAVLSQQAEKLHWNVKADYEKMSFDHRRKKEVEVLSVTHKTDVVIYSYLCRKFILCQLGAAEMH